MWARSAADVAAQCEAVRPPTDHRRRRTVAKRGAACKPRSLRLSLPSRLPPRGAAPLFPPSAHLRAECFRRLLDRPPPQMPAAAGATVHRVLRAGHPLVLLLRRLFPPSPHDSLQPSQEVNYIVDSIDCAELALQLLTQCLVQL